MADHFFGTNRGDNDTNTVDQATSPTKDVEIVLDLAKNLTREDFLAACERLQRHALKANWPPA